MLITGGTSCICLAFAEELLLIEIAMDALRIDMFEEAIGSVKETREKRKAVFQVRNEMIKGSGFYQDL